MPEIDAKVGPRELIRRMALAALNEVKRDRMAARRLFKEWLLENDDLMEAVAGPAIDLAIRVALGRDIGEHRKDSLKLGDAQFQLTDGVEVGPTILPPRSACIPIASPSAAARASAAVIRYLGFYGYPMPVTGKPLGECQGWEIKDGSLAHGKMRRGQEVPEVWLARIWQEYPDRDKPQAQQRRVMDCMDNKLLASLRREALKAVAIKTLPIPKKEIA